MQTCNTCRAELPLTEFYSYAPRPGSPLYYRKNCKKCYAAKSKANAKRRYHENDGLAKQRARRESKKEQYQRIYRRRGWRVQGMDPDIAEAYYLQHNGLCDICKEPSLNGKALHMDHCHSTGVIRGMLCSACNTGIGQFRDDPEKLDRAAEYLRNAQKAD